MNISIVDYIWSLIDCILGTVCGTWYGLSEKSLIIFYENASYLQFYSSAIILSQVVDPNPVFNYNSGYLV